MLVVTDLSRRFGDVVALDNASFEVRSGRIVGFLGPNGAGKTTTMRCIFGLVKPDSGEITWNGSGVTVEERLRFGYMPEERGLYPRMRVREQLEYFGRLSGLDSKQAGSAAEGWLSRLGLADRGMSKLEELSHGNQQRVQLATALVHDPELAVLDEPFAGLDPIGVETMADELRTLASNGTAILFSSHQLDLVEDVCQDVVIIQRGRVVLAGDVHELRFGAPFRHLEVEVNGVPWRGLDGEFQLVAANGRHHYLVDRSLDLDEVVARASVDGEITRVSFEPPGLSELFREAVSR